MGVYGKDNKNKKMEILLFIKIMILSFLMQIKTKN